MDKKEETKKQLESGCKKNGNNVVLYLIMNMFILIVYLMTHPTQKQRISDMNNKLRIGIIAVTIIISQQLSKFIDVFFNDVIFPLINIIFGVDMDDYVVYIGKNQIKLTRTFQEISHVLIVFLILYFAYNYIT